MKIYTKRGDKGQTSLVGGQRVSKSSPRLEAYGTADELNSFVGLLRAKQVGEQMDAMLHVVQNKLFNLGGSLATAAGDKHYPSTTITAEDVTRVEGWIDSLTEGLPVYRAFVLPGGSEAVSVAHVCRTVCRRLERRMVDLQQDEPVDEASMAFVNRLSDFFFTLASRISFESKSKVFLWESN